MSVVGQIVLGSVESSNLESVGYNAMTSLLAVKFKASGVYLYQGVTPKVYDEMMASESIGKFFNERVKENYQVTKLVLS